VVEPSHPFPRLLARDLEGRDRWLPEAFSGERNVVLVAFQRRHQELVDSWLPWLEARSSQDAGLRFFEVPTIARIWAPVRNFIDGGMAAAIPDPAVRRRTLTLYGDLSRLTGPLQITDRQTITVLLVDRGGQVRWSGTGGYDETRAGELAVALERS